MKAMLPVLAFLLACKSESTVKCGPGTVLQNGVCNVASSSKPMEAKAIDAGMAVAADAAAGSATSEPDETTWLYEEKTDQMRNATVRMAKILSENSTDFGAPYGNSKLGIMIRKGDKASGVKLEAFMVIQRGQFECGYDGCAISVKFDDGAVEKWWMTRANSSQALFFGNAAKFIQKMSGAKSLIVEAEFFQEGRRQFTFNVAGFASERISPKQ